MLRNAFRRGRGTCDMRRLRAAVREFVMKNYKIVQLTFGEHVLFELKTSTPNKEPQ